MGSTKNRPAATPDGGSEASSDDLESPSPTRGPDPTQATGARGTSRERREGGEAARGGAIPDLLRRAMAVGFSGFFTTEEAIRRALGDTVPKDWIDFASAQSERTRTEMIQRFSREMADIAARVDVIELFEKLLSGRTIEVRASIRLGDRDESTRSGERGTRVDLTTAVGEEDPEE